MPPSVFRLGFLLLSSPRKAPARARLRGGRVITTGRDPLGVHPELVYRCANLQDWQALAEQTRDDSHLWPGLELVDITTGIPRALSGTELVMLQADLATPEPEHEPSPLSEPAPVPAPPEQPVQSGAPTPTPADPVEPPAPVESTPPESPPVEPAPAPTLLERIAAHFATLPPDQQAAGKSLTFTEL